MLPDPKNEGQFKENPVMYGCQPVKIRYKDADGHFITDSQLAALATRTSSADTKLTVLSDDTAKSGDENQGQGPSGNWSPLNAEFEANNLYKGNGVILKRFNIREWYHKNQQGALFIRYDDEGKLLLKLNDYNAESARAYLSQQGGPQSESDDAGAQEIHDPCPDKVCPDKHNAVTWNEGFAPAPPPGEGAAFGLGGGGAGEDHDHLTLSDVILVTLVEVLLIVGCCAIGGVCAYKKVSEHQGVSESRYHAGPGAGPAVDDTEKPRHYNY